MRGQSCEDGSGARITELIVSEEFGWLHGVHPEAREQKWMARQMDNGTENFFFEGAPVFCERLK